MKRAIAGAIIIGLIFVLGGCGVEGASANSGSFLAVEWNVQALFDGHETGNEYGEYLEKAGWTREKYAARVTAISQAVLGMAADGVPGLIGFIEIENAAVLGDLAGAALSKKGYVSAAFAALPGASLGVGFLSRFPFTELKAHSITIGKVSAPRPVLEARIEPGGKPLVFLLCHWKSKLGGEEATEHLRRASARVVQRRLRELNEAEPGLPVIVMGDLNECHDEFYRLGILSALLPDDSGAADLAARSIRKAAGSEGGSGVKELVELPDALVLSGEKPPLPRYFSGPALYSPWYGEGGSDGFSEGSYHYKGAWETIDHFLLSDSLFDGQGWEYESCRALNEAPFASSNKIPDAYIPRSGRGLSDHLPLALRLRIAD